MIWKTEDWIIFKKYGPERSWKVRSHVLVETKPRLEPHLLSLDSGLFILPTFRERTIRKFPIIPKHTFTPSLLLSASEATLSQRCLPQLCGDDSCPGTSPLSSSSFLIAIQVLTVFREPRFSNFTLFVKMEMEICIFDPYKRRLKALWFIFPGLSFGC